jgi:hypothetical protein
MRWDSTDCRAGDIRPAKASISASGPRCRVGGTTRPRVAHGGQPHTSPFPGGVAGGVPVGLDRRCASAGCWARPGTTPVAAGLPPQFPADTGNLGMRRSRMDAVIFTEPQTGAATPLLGAAAVSGGAVPGGSICGLAAGARPGAKALTQLSQLAWRNGNFWV